MRTLHGSSPALALALIVAFALPARSVLAEAPAEDATKIKVTVHVIHASKKPGSVDPKLMSLEKQLSAFAFKSFMLHSAVQLTLGVGQEGSVSLPDSRVLKLTPMKRDPDGRLKLRISIAKVVDATYVIANGGTLIVGGPRHGDGNLILALTQVAAP